MPTFVRIAAELALVHSNNVLALDPNFPCVGLHQSDNMFKQNALAAATASDDGECFTGLDLKIDTAQNFLSPDFFCQ